MTMESDDDDLQYVGVFEKKRNILAEITLSASEDDSDDDKDEVIYMSREKTKKGNNSQLSTPSSSSSSSSSSSTQRNFDPVATSGKKLTTGKNKSKMVTSVTKSNSLEKRKRSL